MTGGFALAARWNGIKTVQFVEIDPFCRKVLEKNFPGVPIHDDIKTFTVDSYTEGSRQLRAEKYENNGEDSNRGWGFDPTDIHKDTRNDIKTFTNTRCERQTECKEQETRLEQRTFILTGGFPCQPFSCAGKRKGTADDRHLWPEMLRVIKEFKPTWIIGENVAGIRSMELVNSDSAVEINPDIQEDGENDYTTVLDGICNDLEGIGYEVQPIIIPACAVGAPHRRDRVWIVANSKRNRCNWEAIPIQPRESRQEGNVLTWTDSHAPDTESRKSRQSSELQRRKDFERGSWQSNWLEVATRLCRIPNGLPEELHKLETSDRVARLKALGNAIVPAVAFEIMKAIVAMELEAK